MYLFVNTNVLFWWTIFLNFLIISSLFLKKWLAFIFREGFQRWGFYNRSLILIYDLVTIRGWCLLALIWWAKLSHAAKILWLLHCYRLQHQWLLVILVASVSTCWLMLIEFLSTFIVNLISQKHPLLIYSHPLMLGDRVILCGFARRCLALVSLQWHQSARPDARFTLVSLHLY